jgi:hypothetical protein
MQLANHRPDSVDQQPPAESVSGDVTQATSALLIGDTEQIVRTVQTLRSQGLSMAAVIDTVLHPAFDHVKRACESSHCEAFHLHMAIASLVEVAILQRPSLAPSRRERGRVVVAPLPEEPTYACAWFGSLVAVECGYSTQVLGPGLSPASVARATENMDASWVFLAGSVKDNAALATYTTQVLEGTTRSKARILCVGADISPSVGSDAVLAVASYREAERLLAPSSQRPNR